MSDVPNGVFVPRQLLTERRKEVSASGAAAEPKFKALTADDTERLKTFLSEPDWLHGLARSGSTWEEIQDLLFSAIAAEQLIRARDAAAGAASMATKLPPARRAEMQARNRATATRKTFAEEIGTSTSALQASEKRLLADAGLRDLLAAQVPSGEEILPLEVLGRHAGPDTTDGLQTLVDGKAGKSRTETRSALADALAVRKLDRATISYLERTLGIELDDPCACEIVDDTWAEEYATSYRISVSVRVPWGIKWCSKWGIPYPCGIKYKTLTFSARVHLTLSLGATLRLECTGALLIVWGSGCVGVEVAGDSLEVCLYVEGLAGAGADVDITAGSSSGKCLYGGVATLRIGIKVAGVRVASGALGWNWSRELPCVGQFDPDCNGDRLAAPASLIPAAIRPVGPGLPASG